jgi:hypothetical protein
MRQPNVQKVDLPARTLAALAFPQIDYADAYCMRLLDRAPNDIDAIARAGLGTAPRWITQLMRLRDWIVGSIGLKTASRLAMHDLGDDSLQTGDRLGIFRVFERRADELLLGEDDRHLDDFRLSILVHNDGSANWVIIATVVRFNSWLGRAYFLPVRPFHQLIVPAMMRHAYQRDSK